MTVFREPAIKLADSSSVDAYGRLRVSNPHTVFDSKQIFDNAPLFWDDQQVSGATTTSVYSKNAARSRLGVAATTAGKRVRQTFMRFNYQPGKSQLILMTGVIGAGASGITSEIGIHDDENGLFFRNKDATVYVVQRSFVSGSVADTTVTQASWNLDVMDGTGLSGITVDWSKAQLFVVDFQWLSVGRVRLGLLIAGTFHYVHEFLSANILDVVFMSTPNLPLRYSIENDGSGAATTLDHICTTVISEGGVEKEGIIRHVESAGTVLAATTTGTFYALLGIRLKSTHLGATIEPLNIGISEYAGSKFYAWHWLMNPTVAGTFTYSDETNSAVQIAKGATANTITGGTHLGGDISHSSLRGGSTPGAIESALRLGSAIDGTPDELVLEVILRDGDINGQFEGSLLWRELA